MDENDENLIKSGDYVVIQRQGYTKLHKLKPKGTIILRKETVELDNIIGRRFATTFRMYLKPHTSRIYALEEVTELATIAHQLSIAESGNDNRHIMDDGRSQSLTKDAIDKLREDACGSSDIVEQLISNSKTFNLKTGYAQEKYMRKKERKYFEYIQVLKPSIRLLADMFHRQDAGKTQRVRIDDLSQILTYGNVHSESTCLLYDSGSAGLIAAAILNAIGPKTPGQLIHAHPGNECQKSAFAAMQFAHEQSERCVHVNLYSMLRCFYQQDETTTTAQAHDDVKVDVTEDAQAHGDIKEESEGRKRKLSDDAASAHAPPKKKPTWMYENERACRMLRAQVDSLIIVAKEHPVNIVKELIEFLKYGRTFVVFSIVREPLQDLYFFLKGNTDFKGLRLTSNFMRNYQVLDNRTHPAIAMNFGGYLLSGWKVRG